MQVFDCDPTELDILLESNYTKVGPYQSKGLGEYKKHTEIDILFYMYIYIYI